MYLLQQLLLHLLHTSHRSILKLRRMSRSPASLCTNRLAVAAALFGKAHKHTRPPPIGAPGIFS
ncbi:hypothetical protein J7E73_30365 [Paenibacillus albidus]|uniref:hypothetical protein n=1 Tax=Paenibacillus albidus TaxID=2041023 RepID=UPI001BEB601C|nr:hypothetical protein [Paenibacillus albidus]MBT2293324.1 hypothetical protein [Paenibacillus albidus]